MRSLSTDVLVIGGGATGLGVALDAAARGLSVALVEAEDFAKGTSSRATKLVHGGVRYPAQGDIGLVREALHERTILEKKFIEDAFIRIDQQLGLSSPSETAAAGDSDEVLAL